METGVVKWFNSEKAMALSPRKRVVRTCSRPLSEIQGSGFKSLEENHRVSFVTANGPKGPQATKIQVL